MPNFTPNLDLIKPLGNENFSVSHANVNADKIDQKFGDVTRQLEQIAVTPEQYGAVGDGITDDTVALQTAINTGTEIHLTQKYKTSTLIVPDNKKILGKNGELINTLSHTSILKITGSNVVVENVTITGAGNSIYNANGKLIECLGNDNGIGVAPNFIQNITIKNCNLKFSGSFGIFAKYIDNLKVLDCDISKVAYAGVGCASCINTSVNYNKITDITPDAPVEEGFNAYAVYFSQVNSSDIIRNPFSKNCEANNNIINNTPWEGLDTHGGEDIRFINNKISNVPVGIAIIKSDDENKLTIGGCKNIIIQNNEIYNCTTAIALSDVEIDNYHSEVTINSNTIYSCGTNSGGAIYLGFVKGVVLTDNIFKESIGSGVLLRGRVYGFTISNNTFINVYLTTNITGTYSTCVNIKADFAYGTLTGNILQRDETFTGYPKINEVGLTIRADLINQNVEVVGNNFNIASYRKHDIGAQQSLSITPPITQKGSVTISPSTSSNTISREITLPKSYSANTLYDVFATLYGLTTNSPVLVIASRTNTSTITITLRTIDGSNFLNTSNIAVSWMTTGF